MSNRIKADIFNTLCDAIKELKWKSTSKFDIVRKINKNEVTLWGRNFIWRSKLDTVMDNLIETFEDSAENAKDYKANLVSYWKCFLHWPVTINYVSKQLKQMNLDDEENINDFCKKELSLEYSKWSDIIVNINKISLQMDVKITFPEPPMKGTEILGASSSVKAIEFETILQFFKDNKLKYVKIYWNEANSSKNEITEDAYNIYDTLAVYYLLVKLEKSTVSCLLMI